MTRSGFVEGDSDIAVVGMAGRFPGARNVEEYWRNIRDGVESIRTLSDEELLQAGVPESLLRQPNYVKAAATLADMEWFDPGFFGFSPKEAALLDPQHRHFLECAWEALEDSGHVPRNFDGAIGVFAGCGMQAYFAYNLLTNPGLMEEIGLFLVRHTGNDKDFLTTRASYTLDLTGPAVNIQTACSTSLVAVHAACQSLLSCECDLALAGGVTIEVPHGHGYLYKENEILSPDGHCRAFDAESKGTVFGSGVGLVALRRLSEAIEDGDNIHAVIRSTAINNDGARKVGYLAPSVDGHAQAVEEALEVGGIDPRTVSYVEAHGTGTEVGDPIEVAALSQAFRTGTDDNQFCGLGSVKTNIGHCDTAAGVASLIKVIQALKHQQLPPVVSFTKPSPIIDFEHSPFYVSDELRSWDVEGPRRAGVSSLGVGGTNAHAIVEEWHDIRETEEGRPWQVLPLSAKSAAARDRGAESLRQFLVDNPELDLADVALTLQTGREGFAQRRAVVCRDTVDAAIALNELNDRSVSGVAPAVAPSVVFMFPGGGAQYVGMGQGLYEDEPVFRQAVDRCLEIAQPRVDSDLRALLFSEELSDSTATALERPLLALPTLFTMEYALAELWRSWGVEPAAMTGHSMGEYTAACLAGVLSLEDALEVVILRGRLFETLPAGAMLSVSLSEEETRRIIGERLSIAAANAPDLCVLSGQLAEIDRAEQELKRHEVDCRRVKISVAAHSEMVEPILAEFRRGLAAVELKAPEIPFVSNVTGTWITAEEAKDPEYWVRHLRQTVRFAKGMETLLADESRALLEVGPGTTLSALARMSPRFERSQVATGSLRHPQDTVSDRQYILTSLGRLWCGGVEVDWQKTHQGRRRRLSLPTYAFDRQRYWIEPGVVRQRQEKLLARTEDLSKWFYKPIWKEAEAVAESTTPTQWLLFEDRAGLGRRLAAKLRDSGHQVVTVSEGDAFRRVSAESYIMAPEAGPDSYSDLLAALNEDDCLPHRICHLWSVSADETFRRASNLYHQYQERGFYSLLYLIQTLAPELEGDHRIDLWVISNGMQALGDEPLAHPEKATLLGPVMVGPREVHGLETQSVDVELPASDNGSDHDSAWEQLADDLKRVVSGKRSVRVSALRRGKLFEQAFEPCSLEAASKTDRDAGTSDSGSSESRVILVTGGLGGIGLSLSEELATVPGTKLALLTRSEFPDRCEWDDWIASHTVSDLTRRRIENLRKLETLGAEVRVYVSDVTHIEQMEATIEAIHRELGPVRGVLHAAGVTDDGLLTTKSDESLDRVLAPKVQGTLMLERLLQEDPVDFFYVCSSTSVLLGAIGQVDYVAANAFLNAWATSRRTVGGRLAIQWGIWKDAGMGARARLRLLSEDPGLAERIASSHPLLGELSLDDEGCRFDSVLSVEDQWVLEEHRTAQGMAVLPGTAYVEAIVSALSHVSEDFGVENLSFLAPLTVRDDETRDLRLEMTKDEEGWSVEVASRRQSANGAPSAWTVHATAAGRPSHPPASSLLDLAVIEKRCGGTRREETPSAGAQAINLRFGERWHVVKAAAFGEAEALAELELAEPYAADLEAFGLHPALLDLATGFGLPLVKDYSPERDLYVPIGYGKVRTAGSLERRVKSWVRLRPESRDGIAHFDVTITDEEGKPVVEVEDFSVRRVDLREWSKPDAQSAGSPGNALETLATPEKFFLETWEAGIRASEGKAVLRRLLAARPPSEIIVSSIDLPLLIENNEASTIERDEGVRFERPDLGTPYEAPRDEVEKTLVGFWEELLGVDQVGVHDDFFDLGGHSLIAVRLFAKIKREFGQEYPLSLLFDAPTVERCAEVLKEHLGMNGDEESAAPKASRPRFRFVVPLNRPTSTSQPPFFVVSGMLGNVLNLRYLAARLGEGRPVYALQARGLYGEAEPHRRFEEMAADYLEEIRSVQERGPYYLGGFSGGGIVALEMAQQLQSAGEEVGLLVMLDTPAKMPGITWWDRLRIQAIKWKRSGLLYPLRYAKERIRYEMERRRQRGESHLQAVDETAAFRSGQVQEAFLEALDHYEIPRYSGKITLYRPRLDEQAFVLGPNRVINNQLSLIRDDNHWLNYVPGPVEVHVVPGEHNSMVLEPHVRVLAQEIREALDEAAFARSEAEAERRAS